MISAFPWDTKYSTKANKKLKSGKYQIEHNKKSVANYLEDLPDGVVTAKMLADYFLSHVSTIHYYHKAGIINKIGKRKTAFLYNKEDAILALSKYVRCGSLSRSFITK